MYLFRGVVNIKWRGGGVPLRGGVPYEMFSCSSAFGFKSNKNRDQQRDVAILSRDKESHKTSHQTQNANLVM